VVDELGFDQVGKVREGFGLFISLHPRGLEDEEATFSRTAFMSPIAVSVD
jgi:hypothetical protein